MLADHRIDFRQLLLRELHIAAREVLQRALPLPGASTSDLQPKTDEEGVTYADPGIGRTCEPSDPTQAIQS